MTVELYSKGILVEKQTVMISPILGIPLARIPIKIIPTLDAEKQGLFEFSF